MNAEIKKRWVEALRGGEYLQGKTALKRIVGENEKPRYCCLGVLCDLYAKEKNIEWQKAESVDPEKQMLLNSCSYLPNDIQIWSGLNQPNPIIRAEFSDEQLSSLNDIREFSFNQIAYMIEEQL